MNLALCFAKTDKYITYLDAIQKAEKDPDIKNMCTGVAAVSAATVYEIAVKDIFSDFAKAKHKVLHSFTVAFFEKINGKIRIKNIEDYYVKKFGVKYLKRFKKKLDDREKRILRLKRIIDTCINNVLC